MFSAVPIDLSIDAMDVSGEHHLDVLHSVYKTRLSEDGQPIHEETEQYELGASKEGEVEEGEVGNEMANNAKSDVANDAKSDVNNEGKCGR